MQGPLGSEMKVVVRVGTINLWPLQAFYCCIRAFLNYLLLAVTRPVGGLPLTPLGGNPLLASCTICPLGNNTVMKMKNE